MFLGFVLREASLKILISVLVFILCQKTGNFLYLKKKKNSTFHEMKTRP